MLKLNSGLLVHLTKDHNALDKISSQKIEKSKKVAIAKEIACPHCDRRFEKKNNLGNHLRCCGPTTSNKKEDLKVNFNEESRHVYTFSSHMRISDSGAL